MTLDPLNLTEPALKLGLFFDDDAYVETTSPVRTPTADRPSGLVGRQVAGQSFLDAYLSHGTWTELAVLVRHRAAAASLEQFCRSHPSGLTRSRRLRIFEERLFHDDFADDPPARLLYFPFPIDSRYAWARQTLGAGSFSLSGVTHTLCTANVVRQLCDYVTAPFEPHDVLICTSKAVTRMVRDLTVNYAAYLRDRHGGNPGLNIRLETIPLGVDTDRFRPATPDERASERTRLAIADDELAILFVGRLVHHAKAHPFPMFRAVDLAAKAAGRKIHLLMAGWAPNREIRDAFVAGAREFAPSARVSFIDGMDPTRRFSVWKAADLFVSLVDNIQETFGLVIVEAMASGLPVVASDWNGYRDLVDDGVTGFLVPTTMVQGATGTATSRLMFGALDYDHFLAEISQTVTVDPLAAAQAISRLVVDDALRRSFGAAGRARALDQFAWSRVIPAYEALWREQATIRQRFARDLTDRARGFGSPAHYPAPDYSFAGYPTRWLDPDGQTLVLAAPGSIEDLARILAMPLTNHVADRRVSDPDLLGSILKQAENPCPVEILAKLIEAAGVDPDRGRATIAWLLKYDLIRLS